MLMLMLRLRPHRNGGDQTRGQQERDEQIFHRERRRNRRRGMIDIHFASFYPLLGPAYIDEHAMGISACLRG